MAEIIQFDSARNCGDDGDEDAVIQVERTEEFLKTAKELGDYISGLPLSMEQNDKLVHLMVEQVRVAEEGAFRQGLWIGFEYAKDEQANN